MQGRIVFLAGAAIGYVLGARAGRRRYEQIKAAGERLWNDQKVQSKVDQVVGTVQGFVKDKAPDEIKDKIFRNISKRAADLLREDLEAMGPVRLSDVEGAQQEIINVAKRLEAEGKIIISRGGEADALV